MAPEGDQSYESYVVLMKSKIIIPLAIVCIALGGFLALWQSGLPKNIFSLKSGNVDLTTGSDFQGNYVYGAAMNLAWNDLAENILKGAVDLDAKTQEGQRLMRVFNSTPFTKNDLDRNSYYVKSGYGQQTVDAINRESRRKFPDKSFGDLDLSLTDKDIIAYAYFLKKVEYPVEFSERDLYFQNEWVKGFNALNSKQRENVGIVSYQDDDHFILKIKLKDSTDELYVAKGYDMGDPSKIANEIAGSSKNIKTMEEDDTFEMPKLHLDLSRTYGELVNMWLKNKGFEDKYISKMFENIKFDLDQKGARVENEAVIGVFIGTSVNLNQKTPKHLILNKPFFVVMKRSVSTRPYFVMSVNNAAVMLK